MYDLNTPQGWAGLIGEGIVSGVGNSMILLALFVVGSIALIMWYRRATMSETYLVIFFVLGVLRVYAPGSGFGDVGMFALLHNLFLLASAFAFAKVITSGTR